MHSTQILTARPLERRAGFPVTVQATNLTGLLVRLIRSWWRAFARHGEERRLIAHLRAMSDSQLRDLGIARADIPGVVVGRADRTANAGRFGSEQAL
jgi:uncharacterized protein YjiS (DUF1127 family)